MNQPLSPKSLFKPPSRGRLGWTGLILFILMGAIPAVAADSDHVVFDSYADFSSGLCRSVTLSEEGVIEPAPNVKRFAELKADQIWTILQETEGNYLVGTSPEGRLFRVLAGGQVTEVYKFEGTHIYTLAKNAKGEIFAGVSPEGKIYRLNPKGKPTLYFETKQKYIWDMAFDQAGHLYAATGIEGKIFKITGENQGTVFYDSDEVHLRCLAIDKNGNLWVGSAEEGLLFRITPKGEAVVMASTGKEEINRITIAADGTIYFTATGTAKISSNANKPVLGPGFANLPSIMVNPGEAKEAARAAPQNAFVLPGGNAPGRAENSLSQLWRLDSTQFPQAIWGTQETILTLDARSSGLYVGTAPDGYLYRVDERGRSTRVLRVDSSVLSATLGLDSERSIIASSNPAKLFLVNGDRTGEGVYESKVIDSDLFARWGVLRVNGKGNFSAATRSGNTPKPDKSWNEWVTTNDNHVGSPASRYLQYKLSVGSGYVDRVELFFRTSNVAPKIDQIEILPVGIGYSPINLPPVPPQVKTADQLFSIGEHHDNDTGFFQPTRFQPVEGKGLRTSTWRASDVNGDDLLYTVSYRRSESKDWYVLGKDLENPVFSWDTSGWSDGQYYLKITASDSPDNIPEEALTDELESKMFYVDNTAPMIRVLSTKGGIVRFEVREEVSGLRSLTISRDGKEYKSIPPVDGILDSPLETFEVRVNRDQVLFIRAEDNSGNVAGAQAGP